MSTGRLEAFGLSIDLPRGWDGAIGRGSGAGAGGTTHVALHAANFALPPERGDFGGGAVERMGARGVLISLVEYDSEAAVTPLFATNGVPRRVQAHEFSTSTMQRLIVGQSGYQAFANESGRAFCLYVVLGSHVLRGVLSRVAGETLATLEVEPS